jgi:serine protease AprX
VHKKHLDTTLKLRNTALHFYKQRCVEVQFNGFGGSTFSQGNIVFSISKFIVLIESRSVQRALQMRLAAFAASILCASPLGVLQVHAASTVAAAPSKIAVDLQQVLGSSGKLNASWVKDIKGVRYVKALVLSNSTDPDLVQLRADIIARGGSVYMRYTSVSGLSVLLPASQVANIALRADVQGISPNRLTARTASTLESTTGALNLRTYNGADYRGTDGSGVGIAVLDSGIMWNHQNFMNASGVSRVQRAVDFQKVGDATAVGQKDWTVGVDVSASMYPGSSTMAKYEAAIANDQFDKVDLFGHGSHVASVAAGRGAYQAPDSSGTAPGSNLYDVKVLDGDGFGQLSDVIAGIDWVIFHAKEYNIRVMNLSLAADSTESWQTDPLARAARSAVASGITVVVAAGNFGQSAGGALRYGTVSSPGHDPSVITVGSVNMKGTAVRSDDVVNNFSSRGPTRGSYIDASSVRQIDNLLKPDLVAPGNKIDGAMSSDKEAKRLNTLVTGHPGLQRGIAKKADVGRMLMSLSGTSISAPAVSGAVALMLQSNPGLTPPLIKAILQYSAQPLENANLLEQGAGLLNIDGAVKLAQALRTDVKASFEAGTLAAGANLLAAGKSLPATNSTINGQTFNWSRIVYAGGNQIVSGDALFNSVQPIYDHRLVWARDTVQRYTVSYWPTALGQTAKLYVKAIVPARAPNQVLLTARVLRATNLAGASSFLGKTGTFFPSFTLSSWLAVGSGTLLGQGVILSEGLVMSEGLILSEGLVMSEGVILSEGLIMSEGLVLSEGIVMSETGQPSATAFNKASLVGEP